MLSALHGQRPGAVMQDQLRDAGEGAAVLTQHELVLSGPGELQVQEALAAPGGQASQSALITPDLLRICEPKGRLEHRLRFFSKPSEPVPYPSGAPHRLTFSRGSLSFLNCLPNGMILNLRIIVSLA